MHRTGSRSLGDYPGDAVRSECDRCGLYGRYQLKRLIEGFGVDIAVPDLLLALATCERRDDSNGPCGARRKCIVWRRGQRGPSCL